MSKHKQLHSDSVGCELTSCCICCGEEDFNLALNFSINVLYLATTEYEVEVPVNICAA